MRITGGQVFDLEQGFTARDLCTDGALISHVSGDGDVLDASGCYVIPGLVDVHFHGAVGEDFSDATAEGLQKIADYELSQGVTYICPAGMTLPEDQLTAICKTTAAHRKQNSGGAEVVGAHLEGPFLCMAKKGAQNGDYLHAPDAEMLKRLQEAAEGSVRLVTLAPEEPGSVEFIKAAKDMGIHVSLGHTVANYDTAKAAFEEKGLNYRYLTLKVLPDDLEDAMRSKRRGDEQPQARRVSRNDRKNVNEPIVVDLHISELLDNTAGLDNADMLQVQLHEFNRVMEENRAAKGRKIVFIHGKGEGVLRKAILKELSYKYKSCEVQDASFREYGFGATQVTIR